MKGTVELDSVEKEFSYTKEYMSLSKDKATVNTKSRQEENVREMLDNTDDSDVLVFTDGSALGNPGPTGAGAVVYLDAYQSVPVLLKKCVKVSNGAKIRNRYNQVPHLTQDTNGKVTNSQKTPQTRAKRPAPPPPPPQQATKKHTQTDAHKTQQTQDRTKTQKIHKRSTAPERSAKHPTGGPKPAQRRQPHPQLRRGPRHIDTWPA